MPPSSIILVACCVVTGAFVAQDAATGALLGGAVGSGALLVARGAVLQPIRRAGSARLLGSERGQAMVEFAIIAPIMLQTIFFLMQYGLILMAYAVVNWAAWNAARIASIQIAEDPVALGRLGPGGTWIPVAISEDVPTPSSGLVQTKFDPFPAGWRMEPGGTLQAEPRDTIKWRQIRWGADYSAAALVTPGMVRRRVEGGPVEGLAGAVNSWLNVNGDEYRARAGLLARIDRQWLSGDAGITDSAENLDELAATESIVRRIAAAVLLTRVTIEGGEVVDGLRGFQEGDLIEVVVEHHYPLVIPMARRFFGRELTRREAFEVPDVWLDHATTIGEASASSITNLRVHTIRARAAMPCEDIKIVDEPMEAGE